MVHQAPSDAPKSSDRTHGRIGLLQRIETAVRTDESRGLS
jgi:hypothetical protein